MVVAYLHKRFHVDRVDQVSGGGQVVLAQQRLILLVLVVVEVDAKYSMVDYVVMLIWLFDLLVRVELQSFCENNNKTRYASYFPRSTCPCRCEWSIVFCRICGRTP